MFRRNKLVIFNRVISFIFIILTLLLFLTMFFNIEISYNIVQCFLIIYLFSIFTFLVSLFFTTVILLFRVDRQTSKRKILKFIKLFLSFIALSLLFKILKPGDLDIMSTIAISFGSSIGIINYDLIHNT